MPCATSLRSIVWRGRATFQHWKLSYPSSSPAAVAESLDAPEDLITMDNGCICCSVRGDLVRTLGSLAKRRKDFDAVLLETTGLADPAPIVYTIQTNPKMSDNYRIDSIVSLADCKHLASHLDEKKPDNSVNEALQQIAFSDKVSLINIRLFSKCCLTVKTCPFRTDTAQ